MKHEGQTNIYSIFLLNMLTAFQDGEHPRGQSLLHVAAQQKLPGEKASVGAPCPMGLFVPMAVKRESEEAEKR